MFSYSSIAALVVSALAVCVQAQKKPTFSVTDLPDKWEPGQVGTNQCGQYKPSNQKSMCQNVFINSVTDFCLWAPYKTGTVGAQEELMISYCIKAGYGTRLIPDGTIKGAHFIKVRTVMGGGSTPGVF